MKAYVVTTGILFALLTVLHIWRGIVERHLATSPHFIGLTLASALLSLWAVRLLMRSQRS
jgi:hypothetical protein